MTTPAFTSEQISQILTHYADAQCTSTMNDIIHHNSAFHVLGNPLSGRYTTVINPLEVPCGQNDDAAVNFLKNVATPSYFAGKVDVFGRSLEQTFLTESLVADAKQLCNIQDNYKLFCAPLGRFSEIDPALHNEDAAQSPHDTL